MGQYLGIVFNGFPLTSVQLTKGLNGLPVFADAAPTYRIYGPGGLMANGTGSLLKLDPSSTGGAITGATNASPIQITSANHGLSTGTRVSVSSVGGNTAANGDWQITRVDGNNFTLTSSSGNGTYTSGGVWFTAGLYAISYTPQASNGFAAGINYAMVVSWAVAGLVTADVHTFTVD